MFHSNFKGSLTTSFSTTAYEKEIDTLRELDDSGLIILSSALSIKNLFGDKNDVNPVLLSLMSKLQTTSEADNVIDSVAYQRNVCGVERYSDFNIIIRVCYIIG